jgi:N6-adenosine-specific RNA methylase IME4
MDTAQYEAAGMTYGAILADPPWAFRTYSNKHTTPHRCAVDHYQTMAAGDLASLPVASYAAKDCALFMWAVDSHVPQSIDLAKAWGFEFKTVAFVWSKGRIGMGYWTRKQAEICLLFTKGKPRRISKGVRQVIEAPRREHSRKPDEQYARIQALVAGPYLELFARQQWPGWSAIGNETSKFEVAA